MFAKDDEAAREWIRDGVTAAKAKSLTWQEQRQQGQLRMPSFKRRLSARQIADPLAMFFIQRAALEMPGFQRHLQPGDEDALSAYIRWLRAQGTQ